MPASSRSRAIPTPTTCWARRPAPRPTPALPRGLCHAIAAIAKRRQGRRARQPRHLGQALGAASALRIHPPRPVMAELVPRALQLAGRRPSANIGFNIDAEEQDRLDLSLDVIEAVLADPSSPAGTASASWCRPTAARRAGDRGLARWPSGSTAGSWCGWSRAPTGTPRSSSPRRWARDFPVFTRKVNTDVSYMACARMLLDRRDRIYPQFATHNAHTCGRGARHGRRRPGQLRVPAPARHGRGAARDRAPAEGTRCRIYAPVGAHRDLLAYLVRRLLENGANSSFVNQIVDETDSPERDRARPGRRSQRWATPSPTRRSAARRAVRARAPQLAGWINEPTSILPLLEAREAFADADLDRRPDAGRRPGPRGAGRARCSPADTSAWSAGA
jgi:RHH-type transcriptional regulator, proline utilization regulon repressor / proline dehydrogenase / delta 1-pyrroline-5-carboxylate dehydrogenase